MQDIDFSNGKVLKVLLSLQAKQILPDGKLELLCMPQPNSIVWRVIIADSVFFVKYLKQRKGNPIDDLKGSVVREYRVLKQIHSVFANLSSFNTPKPVCCIPEDLLIITEELKGTSLLDICNKHACRFSANIESVELLLNNVGHFLKILHESDEKPFLESDVYSITNYIKERLIAGIFTFSQEKEIVAFLDQGCKSIVENMPLYKKCPVHHDLNPGNVLLDGETVNVLDFGAFKYDHYFQDLVYFKLMLEGQLGFRLKYKKHVREELLDAFFEGYGCQPNIFSFDYLFAFYMLKNWGIILKTTILRISMAEKLPGLVSIRYLKNKVVNNRDCHCIKREILNLVRSFD